METDTNPESVIGTYIVTITEISLVKNFIGTEIEVSKLYAVTDDMNKAMKFLVAPTGIKSSYKSLSIWTGGVSLFEYLGSAEVCYKLHGDRIAKTKQPEYCALTHLKWDLETLLTHGYTGLHRQLYEIIDTLLVRYM